MGLLKCFIDYIVCRRWRYVLSRSFVRVQRTAEMNVGKAVIFRNCRIFVDNNSSLTVSDGVAIENADIYVKGVLKIGEHTIIGKNKDSQTTITIENGSLAVGHHSKLSCNRVWIRFGGDVHIGNYTNYNAGGELRCDESVIIGDFGMISYNVNIWDTNTHTIYPPEQRRSLAREYWPYFGKEVEKPKTSSITIGNDVWIGENVSVLKGTIVGDEVVIGYGTTLIGEKIETGRTVVPETKVRIVK